MIWKVCEIVYLCVRGGELVGMARGKTDMTRIDAKSHINKIWSAGSMAERLTTNQEVPGSTPGWIVDVQLAMSCSAQRSCCLFGRCLVVGGDDAKTVGFQETRFLFACTCMDIMVGVQKGEGKQEVCQSCCHHEGSARIAFRGRRSCRQDSDA